MYLAFFHTLAPKGEPPGPKKVPKWATVHPQCHCSSRRPKSKTKERPRPAASVAHFPPERGTQTHNDLITARKRHSRPCVAKCAYDLTNARGYGSAMSAQGTPPGALPNQPILCRPREINQSLLKLDGKGQTKANTLKLIMN